MKKKIKELEAKLSESEGMKETLQTVLVSAQKSGETLKANAEKEAEFIKKSAENEALLLKNKAEEEIAELERKKEALKAEVELFITKMSALFEAQIKYLNKTE